MLGKLYPAGLPLIPLAGRVYQTGRRLVSLELVRQARDWRNLAGEIRAGFRNRDRANEAANPAGAKMRMNNASAPASP